MDGAKPESSRISRRRFLRGAALGAAAIVGSPIVSLAQVEPRRRSTRRQTVAIFGGGVAGLTAAHELAERGFDVTVYERRAWGGKARSTQVPGSGSGGRLPLPGEHGFRVTFGFYQTLPDTMRRIPFGDNPNGVFDNLVTAPQISISRADKRDLALPLGALDPRPYTPAQIQDLVLGVLLQTDLPPEAAAFFGGRMLVFLSSCEARRYDQWERTPWADFVRSDRYGIDYRQIIADLLTRFAQASRADRTSTKFVGRVFEAVVYNVLGRNSNGPFDRILNLPTNEAWIEPWLAELEHLGVELRLGESLDGLDLGDGRITGASVCGPSGTRSVVADWYVCALPVERARELWTPAILDADPRLEHAWDLETGWMNGIQFYLRERTPIAAGHVAYVDSPWAVSSISQAQFWASEFADRYGDGVARDCLSVVISDWNRPGVLYGKPARELSPDEIAREAWEQIKRHVNDSGREQLRDDLLLSWSLDPGLLERANGVENEDPLVLPTVGAWANRPEAGTAIENLLLAGDYVRSDAEMANMEAANDTGRRAANAILDRSGSHATACELFAFYQPPEWEPLKRIDEILHRSGQPNLFDEPTEALP